MASPAGRLRAPVTGLLLDSPVSRLGCAVATLVGLAVGVPLSTGRIRVVGDLIVCRGLPRWAFRRGGTCVGRVYLTRYNDGPRVLRHEAVHVTQWRRYGMLMPLMYFLAGSDPLTNRFEIEAGLEEGGYR
ncbi:Fe-S oxidoreductase [Frigoribacterium sp. Leaf172]|nr:Fe-S oxidoreductase [Frigoribacterium sp. Leaf172]